MCHDNRHHSLSIIYITHSVPASKAFFKVQVFQIMGREAITRGTYGLELLDPLDSRPGIEIVRAWQVVGFPRVACLEMRMEGSSERDGGQKRPEINTPSHGHTEVRESQKGQPSPTNFRKRLS